MARRSNKPTSLAEAVIFNLLTDAFDDYYGYDIEATLKSFLRQVATATAAKIAGIRVNNTDVTPDANGKVDIIIPSVDASLNASSANPVQNAVVTERINAIISNMPVHGELDTAAEQDGMVPVRYYNEAGDELFSVLIPAAQEIGEVITPRVTTALTCPARVKLGDTITMQWSYTCIRTVDGASETVNYPAQTLIIEAKVGTTTVWSQTLAQVPVGQTGTVTLDPSVITSAGTVSISVVATTQIDEETKTSRGSKSVTVITMSLATTFDPASQLALSNGYTDGQTINIPYAFTVPTGTQLKVWVDGVLDSTSQISGTGRNYVYLAASNLAAGRHNVQMLAIDSSGLLSNAVSVDVLKAGSNADYLGVRLTTDVGQQSEMPLPYAYGTTPIAMQVAQFEDLTIDVAAWNAANIVSTILVLVDGATTQTLSADRSMQTITQRFDTAGTHTMTVMIGSTVRTFAVEVAAASGVSEQETVGYLNKLTSTGRSNSESNPADWGGITSFLGVDWRTNGWVTGSDGVTALLLTNGAVATIDIRPFILDANTGYSIPGDGLGANGGMTLEMEVMISQVMERGATLIHCLCDNEGMGYPVGIRVTTEEAGLYFGGVEEITTAEDLVDENGNYIDYDGNIVDEDHKVPLKVTRPHGVAQFIAVDRWVRLTFVVQPVVAGYGLAMLFINGVLSRANRYDTNKTLIQNVPVGITFDSDKADIRVRNVYYYRSTLIADEVLSNCVINQPTAAAIQAMHNNNAVGDQSSTTDSDGNIAISRDALASRGRGILVIIRSDDSGTGLSDLFVCTDKKQNFKADLVLWIPPLDANGNPIGEGFDARNVRIRIQGTSSVKYPYKNIRIYLTTAQGGTRSLSIGGVDVTATAKGYALRGSANSIEQAVLCAKTDFVDSSLVMNTGGAHLFNTIMPALGLSTPPQQHDARVRQAIDGIPCDVYAATSETGTLTYYGQFVLNNEKSKSGKIFGMEGVKDSSGNSVTWPMPIALEALTNSSPMTLFQAAGTAGSNALATQLAAEFDDGFEFNHPEDAVWSTIGEEGDFQSPWNNVITDSDNNTWQGAKGCIKRLMGFIYSSVAASAGVTAGTMSIASPDYGTSAGWSDASKAKWVSSYFKQNASKYFNINHLLTYYLIIDYRAGVDQLAKNILWRTWDGLIWWATYYDGDTAMSIRNDAFMVYLYNVTRDTYDNERSKYAFEGHSSWLWCLVLANFEDELKQCAANLRNQLTLQVALQEYNVTMMGNWSERQYNKSQKLKYIDTIETKNYVYTLTGNRELHRTQYITDRYRLLDARYGAGGYNDDVITFTVVRNASQPASSLTLLSGDLYYFGYKLNGIWLQGPSRAAAGESLTLNFTATLATNDPLMLGGASCISELDLTGMGSQLNGTVGLFNCTMLRKLVMPATNGAANAPLTLGNISKLEYIDITGQTAVNTGTAGVFDVSRHTRLTTLLAGGTSLTTINLPEGAPLTTLVLPSTLQNLTLRYLPRLTSAGLTLQGTSGITAFNFAECPGLSWQTLLASCPNVTRVRIEGMSGRVHSSSLLPFMQGYDASSASPTANMTYHGLTSAGTTTPYPQLIGSVQLIDVVDDFATFRAFFALCGLELTEAQFSEYVFDDLETDPANVTNEDNRTGYAYRDPSATYSVTHPNGYQASGHVKTIRNRCKPVLGWVKTVTEGGTVHRRMHIEALSKDDYTKRADGTTSSVNDISATEDYGQDVYVYVPKYYYKGVNDYRHARKHLFLSGLTTTPLSTANVSQKLTLSSLSAWPGRVLDVSGQWLYVKALVSISEYEAAHAAVETTDPIECLSAATGFNTYRVAIPDGIRQVRFPGCMHSYAGFAFTNEVGECIEVNRFTMTNPSGNPSDYDNSIGDYIFATVPEGARYLYFSVTTTSADLFTSTSGEVPQGSLGPILSGQNVTGYYAVLLTDSAEIEAIEPDWVEHKSELIGAYQGWVNGMGAASGGQPVDGLRSLSGKTTTRGNGTSTIKQWTYDNDGNPTALPSVSLNGTAQDFFNLASVRTALTHVEGGEYSTVPYETSKDMANLIMAWHGTRDVETIVGRGSSPGSTGIRNSIGLGDSAYSEPNSANKMWGLECWTATTYEWMDKGCLNVPSFDAFKKAERSDGVSSWKVDYFYNIVQQDGSERRVKAASTNQATNVARVRFGRYCDIVVSSYAGDSTYATCYATYQSTNGSRGRVLGRSGYVANALAGVVYSGTYHARSNSVTSYGARLCFFGEIENESDVS